MSKPSGVSLTLGSDGLPNLRVRHASPVEDAVWDAVEKAVDAGWSPRDFVREAECCWDEKRRQDRRHEKKEWPR